MSVPLASVCPFKHNGSMNKKASKKAERFPEPNQTAFTIVQALTVGPPPGDVPSEQLAGAEFTRDGKNAAAVALGPLG